MADAARYGALCRAALSLEYLYTNSTTHDFLFGAIAELIDNSRDADATRLDIYTVNNENLQGGFMLCLLDDGCGMTPRKTVDLVHFGRSSKRDKPDMIGCYGNGLKSGSMRIGKDLILFTKEENTMTSLLLSQTFCETEGLSEVIVPILSWSSHTREPIIDSPETFATQLSIIYKYSPFKNNAEVMKQFDAIYGKTGTLLVIYNLKLTLNFEPELDILTDVEDMLLAVSPENLPERQSLRAYTAVLYLEPRMKIFIQTKEVETKRLPHCFYRPRMYPYISSSFKHAARNELEKAEMDVKAAEGAVREAKSKLQQSQDSLFQEKLELALMDAMENEKEMRETVKNKQRNLKKPKKLFLTFGVNILNRSQYGMLIYSNKRLIKMFEKVGPQKNRGSYFASGAVGIVDVPCEVMEPTHNKQAFVNTREYNHLLKAMENCLIQYWKDIGLSQKEEALFWNDFGYLSNKWSEKPSESIQYKRRRAVEIPDIVQCDICLKWRLLSFDTDINHGGHHSIWNCRQNPNPLENKCDVPECLPPIPLGTFNPTKSHDKQKLVVEAIRQRKWRLENLEQKLHLIEPHTIAQPTADSKTRKDMLCERKAFHKDPHPACRRLIKSSTNKRRTQHSSHQKEPPAKQMTSPQRRQHPCQEEKCSLSAEEERKDHDMAEVQAYGSMSLSAEEESKDHDISEVQEYGSMSLSAEEESKDHDISDVQAYDRMSLSTEKESKDHDISEVSPIEIQDEKPCNEKLEFSKTEADSKREIICIIISDSDTEVMPEDEDIVFMHKEEKQEECNEKGGSAFSPNSCFDFEKKHLPPVDLESGSMETSEDDSKEQALVAEQESNDAVSHTCGDPQSISENKMVETLTARIKEILLYFLPKCNLSREHISSMTPEDILSMFKLHWDSERNNTVPVDLNQYISQYEDHLSEKLQSIKQHGLLAKCAAEKKISLCRTQIKVAEERIKHLQEKVAQFLMSIHPHLQIDNQDDIGNILEKVLK
nr:MORC family CW-type zinc finger protein 1 isoform X2 [Zootoca vivipara]